MLTSKENYVPEDTKKIRVLMRNQYLPHRNCLGSCFALQVDPT